MTWLRAALISAAFSLALIGSAQPTMPTRTDRFDASNVGIDQKLDNQIPLDLEFTDENGRKVKLGDYFNGKDPVIIEPVWYECRSACVLVTEALLKVFTSMQKEGPGSGFQVITFTIKPSETPKMAREYKDMALKIVPDKESAEKGWHMLTGDLEAISQLSKAVGFRYTYDPKLDKVNHSAGIMIATPKGRVAQYLYGTDFAAKFVDRSLKSASESRIAPLAEVRLFGCLEFDPTTGKTRLVMWRAVQLGGILTFVILAISIAVMSFKYKGHQVDSGGSDA